MVGLSVKKFGGAVPTTGDRALPDGFAVESVNTWYYANEMRGIRPPIKLLDINPGVRKVFRIPKGTPGGDANWPYHDVAPTAKPSPSYLGDSTWKFLDDPYTDVVKGILVNDSHERWYFCSPTHGISMNTQAGLVAGNPDYILGVETPTVAPVVDRVDGGTATVDETRAYVYTYQTIFGEESAPSPPGLGTGKPDGTWQIANLPSDPDPSLGYVPYKYLILYRTLTSSNGTSIYYQVKKFNLVYEPADPTATPPKPEVPVDVIPDPYGDALSNTNLTLNLQLQTIGWLPPPKDLQGIVGMPNGFLIGWDAKGDIWMSVPYQPHAWPIEYILSTEFPIVGMGVIGNSCICCTQGYPSALTGVEPASMSFTKLNTIEPCLSRGSIVSTLQGVFYASQNGIVAVTPGGLQNMTDALISREEWIKKYSPEYLQACRYQNGYLALRMVPNMAVRSAFYLDPTQIEVALTELTDFEYSRNVIADIWSGEVFKLKEDPDGSNGAVWRWDPPVNDDLLPTRWKSKEYQLATEVNLGVYAIYWDHDRYLANTYKGGTDIIGADVPVRFMAWCNRRLVYDQDVPVNKNGKAVRLPSGFTGDIWQFEIRARAPIYSLIVAQTPRELAGA